MTLSPTHGIALLGLVLLVLAYLLATMPLALESFSEPPGEQEQREAGVRFEPPGRGALGTVAVATFCSLVALWAGSFLAAPSTASGTAQGANRHPEYLRFPPPVTGRNPGPGGTRHPRAGMPTDQVPTVTTPVPGAVRAASPGGNPGASSAPSASPARPAQVPVRTLPRSQPRPHVPLLLAQAPAPGRGRSRGSVPAPRATEGPGDAVYDPDELTQVDFDDVDIKAVLRFLAEKTRTNYFLDPGIQAKITVIGPRQIRLAEAVTFLEAALEARGFTVVDSGTFKQVIPKDKAAGADVPLYLEPPRIEGTPLEKERTVTEIIQLRHATVAEVKTAIQGLLTESSKLVEHLPSNKIILTETVRNLERLKRVIAELDVEVHGKTVFLLPVRFRKAADLVTGVTEILAKEELEKRLPQTKQVQATKPALLADEAQNLVIVVATGADFAKVKSLVERIDVDPDAGPEIEFLPLEHAVPGEVVQKVTAALQTDGVPLPPFSLVPDDRTQSLMLRTRSRNLRVQIRDAVRQLDKAAELPETVQVRVYRMNFAEAAKIAELLGQVDFTAGLPGTDPAAKNGGKGSGPQIKIVADENTNALVITAPQALFPAIERVVEELDVVKPQVMVEVLIAEIDYDWAKGQGLDFNFLNESSSSTNRPFGIGNLNQVEGLAAGGLPDGLSVGMIHGRDFDFASAVAGDAGELSKIAALIRIFQNTTHANILSSPTLLTSDNEAARIAIGERIQLPGSFATAANTGLNTVTSFNSEDLGVILEITPRITRDDHVILKVDQSIKARTGDLLGSLETPVLSNREVSTSVNALDGDTVVIGGLLSEEEQISESRIPLLSRLPGLGKLFRSRQRTTRKTNLMIFLTPHIVRGEDAARHLTERSRQEISEEIEQSQASPGSTIRQVFAPGRSLGRYRAPDLPSLAAAPRRVIASGPGAVPLPEEAASFPETDSPGSPGAAPGARSLPSPREGAEADHDSGASVTQRIDAIFRRLRQRQEGRPERMGL